MKATKADMVQNKTFVLGKLIYLPHYNLKGQYVSVGYGKHNFNLYTEKQLRDAGAKPKMEMLWERFW